MCESGSALDFQNETIVLFQLGKKTKSLFCLYYNQNACCCFSLSPEPLALLHPCLCVPVLYSLDRPAVGCTSVHIKSLALTPD